MHDLLWALLRALCLYWAHGTVRVAVLLLGKHGHFYPEQIQI